MSHPDAAAATAVLRDFVALAQRLPDRDVVILRPHTDWAAFGSWELEAQDAGRHGPVLRATWDGRDSELEVHRDDILTASRQGFDSARSALRHLEARLIADDGGRPETLSD